MPRFKIDVEIPILLLFFATSFSDSLTTNLLIYRTCYVILGYNKSECALLGTDHPDNITANLEKATDPYVATIGLVKSVPVGLLTGIFCFFVGSWTDKYGRKPVIIAGTVGFTIQYVLRIIYALIPDLSPWYTITWEIPIILTGGFSSFVTVLLCYISDVTTEEDRGIKMSLFQGVLLVASLCGTMTSSYVFYATNYVTIFFISLVVMIICLIYVIYILPESVQFNNDNNDDSKTSIKELFHLKNLKDMLVTTFKPRPNNGRTIILLCIGISMISLFVMLGESSVFSLYLRTSFKWSLTHLNMFSSAVNVAEILVIILGSVLLEKLLKIPETIILFSGCVAKFTNALLLGIVTTDIGIYIASTIGCLNGLMSPMSKSLISKIIPSAETGKFFSFIVTSETLLGLLGSPLYTEIYNNTINTNPGIFNFVTAGFYLVEILLSISVIITYHFKIPQYNVLDNETETEELIINS